MGQDDESGDIHVDIRQLLMRRMHSCITNMRNGYGSVRQR